MALLCCRPQSASLDSSLDGGIQKRVRRKGHHSTRRSKRGQMTFSENKRGMDVGGLWQASCSHLSSQPSKASEMATPKSSHLARGSLVAPLQKPPIPFPQSPLALHLLWGKLGPLCPAETARPQARCGGHSFCRCCPASNRLQLGKAGSLRGGLGGSEKRSALVANIRKSDSTSRVRLEFLLAL